MKPLLVLADRCITCLGAPGCTDTGAENYNPDATKDDESCTYATCCGYATAHIFVVESKNPQVCVCRYGLCCREEGFVNYVPNCVNHQETACGPLGVGRIVMHKSIEVSPDRVTVDIHNTPHLIQVTNVSGEIVFSETSSGTRYHTLTDLEAGIYIVKITASYIT